MFLNILASALDAFSVALLIPFLNTLFGLDPLGNIKSPKIQALLQATIGSFTVPGDRMGSLRNVILVVMAVVIVKNILVWLSGQLGASLQEYVTRDLRNALYRHLDRLPLGYFTKTKAGQIMSRVTNDTAEARIILTQVVTQSLQAVGMVVASIAFMIAISWELTFMSLVVVPILVAVLQPLLRKLRKGNRKRGAQHGEMTSVLQETLGGMRLVKSFRGEAYEDARFFEASNLYAKTTVRLTRLSFLAQPLSEVIGMMIAVVLLWFGARTVIVTKTMTGSDLITFLIYVLRLMTPLKQLTSVPAAAQASLASAERIFEVLDTPAEHQTDTGTKTISAFNDAVEFEHVSFGYDSEPVLRDVSLTAKRGEIVALVGASGAGKSTLVDLIPRFYEITGGHIRVDGIDVREIALPSLRSMIGIVSQDTVLFHDTVRNNLAYGAQDKYTDAQIEAAAQLANAHGFISALPDGYNTMLGERGMRLSGGQRQRLAIARALLTDPPILILDEATSALDTESERLVQSAVDRLLQGRTVFVIAHRLSTIQHASQILVMDHGEIVERGTHAELLALGGAYARLHSLQFRDEGTPAAAALPHLSPLPSLT